MDVNTYDTLVLSGGSSKGLLTIGSMQYLYDNYLVSGIVNYIGTSSGAIICYLLSIGYTPIEIIVYISTNQILEKMQNLNIVSMINGTGAISFANIQEQLEKMTISKIGKLLTLKDLYLKFNKNLICVTHNLTTNKTEYLSHETHPELPCLTALRMSSNLPLFFEKYNYNNKMYVDGGLSDNFAIDIGDNIGNKIIGIIINEEDDTSFHNNEMNIIEYIYKLLYIPILQSINSKINNLSQKTKVIRLTYPTISIFNYNLDSKTKLEMFSSGYKQISQQI